MGAFSITEPLDQDWNYIKLTPWLTWENQWLYCFHLLLFHILKLLPAYNRVGGSAKTTKTIRIWNVENLKIQKKLLAHTAIIKYLRLRWLKEQKFVSYTQASGIQIKVLTRFGFLWELTSWFADVRLLTVHWHSLTSVCRHLEQEQAFWYCFL